MFHNCYSIKVQVQEGRYPVTVQKTGVKVLFWRLGKTAKAA